MSGDRVQAGEVLLDCLRGGGDPTGTRRLGRLSDRDWEQVVQESTVQGLAPLLYHRLQAAGPSAVVPARVNGRLRDLAIQGALESLRLYRELAEILGALRAEGIAVIVLKGAYLAEAVYDDRALRSMRDVDLMVRKHDLARAEAKLLEIGYSRLSDRRDFSACHHLRPVIKPGAVPIEIHWTIESPTEPFDIDIDGLWDRARPATIAGVDVLVLSPEDLLLHLCLHTAFHHHFELGMRGCWDILETTRRFQDGIDWEQVRQRARRWRAEKYVYLTLRLASEMLGAAVPRRVLADLEPKCFDARLITLARAEILTGSDAAAISPRFARVWGTELFREKVLVLAQTVFPAREAIRRMYPSGDHHWVYLYYPVRWLHLLWKYGQLAWQMTRDDEAAAAVRREHDRAHLMDWLRSVSA